MRYTLVAVIGSTLCACSTLISTDVNTNLTELNGGNYKIDPSHSRVIFKVGHMGLSKYVGRFNQFDARLTFDPEKPQDTYLEATVNTSSIDVGDLEFSESLASRSWLNTSRFPQAVFRSTRTRIKQKNAEGKSTADFCGNFTLMGATKPLCLEVTFNGGAYNMLTGYYTLGFESKTTFKRSDFGLNDYIPAVSDVIELEIHSEFQKVEN